MGRAGRGLANKLSIFGIEDLVSSWILRLDPFTTNEVVALSRKVFLVLRNSFEHCDLYSASLLSDEVTKD